MAVTGYLAEFSLAELFQFLEQGNKVGLLTICTLVDNDSEQQRNHHIWFNQGRIVAASNLLDQQGLLRLISKRDWLGDRAASRLAQSCAISTPMGLCLKSQGVLNAEQLKLLFYTQVMQQVCALFALKDGWFKFDAKAPLPTAEMTGLSPPATEVTLAGLRALKDWSALADKLPDPLSALVSTVTGKPQQKLNQAEWQVWEFTNGTIPLTSIAKQLQLPIEKIQQIAFQLMVSGLAEEMPLVAESSQARIDLDTSSDLFSTRSSKKSSSRSPSKSLSSSSPRSLSSSSPRSLSSSSPRALSDSSTNSSVNSSSNSSQAGATQVSQSFLQNLVGFLRGKV